MAARGLSLPAPLRVMFDSNAYDEIMRHDDVGRLSALIEAGELIVITTHVQEDELRQIADTGKRTALLDILWRIGGRRIAPADVMDGNIAYLSRDDRLAGVAEACCDLLVTQDRPLAERCHGITLGYDAFRQQVGLGRDIAT